MATLLSVGALGMASLAHAVSFPPAIEKAMLSVEAHSKCSIYAQSKGQKQTERRHFIAAVDRGRDIFVLFKQEFGSEIPEDFVWLERNGLSDVVLGQMIEQSMDTARAAMVDLTGASRKAKASELYSSSNCGVLLP